MPVAEIPCLRPLDRSHGLLKAVSDWVGWRRSLKPVDSVWLRDWEPVGFVRELAGGVVTVCCVTGPVLADSAGAAAPSEVLELDVDGS